MQEMRGQTTLALKTRAQLFERVGALFDAELEELDAKGLAKGCALLGTLLGVLKARRAEYTEHLRARIDAGAFTREPDERAIALEGVRLEASVPAGAEKVDANALREVLAQRDLATLSKLLIKPFNARVDRERLDALLTERGIAPEAVYDFKEERVDEKMLTGLIASGVLVGVDVDALRAPTDPEPTRVVCVLAKPEKAALEALLGAA